MTAIYAWVETMPDGYQGVIAAIVPELANTLTLLQHKSKFIAEKFQDLAELHSETTGNPVCLMKFALAETVKVLPSRHSPTFS